MREREYQYDVNPKSSGTLVEALKEAPGARLDRRQHEGRLEDDLRAEVS